MNNKEFIKALKDICEEKNISEEVIFDGSIEEYIKSEKQK